MIDVRTETAPDGVTLRLEGELDLASAPQVEAAIGELEELGTSTIVLDLRGIRFLDSTGLRVILSADSRARKDGRRLRVVRGPDEVHRVFRIALLDRRLDFIDGEDT